MKVVILAGGYGSRLGNHTQTVPKPMIRVGGQPLLWHIMKIYSYFGFNDFLVALGYKADVVKEYFLNFDHYTNDVTVDLISGRARVHRRGTPEPWQVTLADTGLETLKGARLKRIAHHLNVEVNMLTYGDGVADLDIPALLAFHRAHGKTLTISGVHPPSRFGEMLEQEHRVLSFEEKPQASCGRINGGYMVFNRALLDELTTSPDCDLERGAIERLVGRGEVMMYRHDGQWACVDHERDLNHLNRLWERGEAFWKLWQDEE